MSSDVNIDIRLIFRDANANLILCDGATLTINNNENDSGIEIDGNLFIYGQTAGNGTASITSGNIGIGCDNLIINGGIVSSTSTFSTAIRSNFDITINRGSATVKLGTVPFFTCQSKQQNER